MPKIRGVKPDYWTDEDIVELSIPARLLFIGLWNHACDNGHLQDKPKQIKMRVLPGDDVSVADLLRELATKKRIQRGAGWITVPNLGQHQKIDVRYFTSCDKEGCEDPPEKVSQRESRRANGVHTPGARGRTPSARGDGDGEVKGSDGDRAAAGKPRKKSATVLPAEWQPNANHQDFATENALNLDHEVSQFRAHAEANDRRQVSWDAAFRQWLGNAVKFTSGRSKIVPLRPQPDEQGRIKLPPPPRGFFDQ